MKTNVKHTEEYYMKAALQEALKAFAEDEVPVGAVIVKDDKIIARAHNAREKKQQSYAHAEMLAIQKASKKLGTWCLNDCDLYVTLEPCMMCMGALNLARIHTVYWRKRREIWGSRKYDFLPYVKRNEPSSSNSKWDPSKRL